MTYISTFASNKFHAKKTSYGDYTYDSKLEASKAMDLDLLLKAKEIKKWERQVPEELYAYGQKICTYKVDFKIWHKDGTIEFVERKGLATPDWRLKWKMLEAKYDKEISKGRVKLTIEWGGKNRNWVAKRFQSYGQ